MQIYRPEKNHAQCSKSLDDLRLNCQIKELGQILSTTIWMEDCGTAETLYATGLICLPTHEHNSIVKHCKRCYFDAAVYLASLHAEYCFRFGKIHNTFNRYHTYMRMSELFKKYERRPFLNHTTNFRHVPDVTEAYQQCLIEKWQAGNPKWTNRQRPAFFMKTGMVHENWYGS